MKLHFRLDQVTAFRQGIDSHSATANVDIDPRTLDEDDRALLASRLNPEGKVCGRDRTGKFSDGYSSYESVPTRDADDRRHIRLVTAVDCTLTALLAAIRLEEATIAATNAETAKQQADEQARRRDATLERLKARQVTESRLDVYAWYDGDRLMVEERTTSPRGVITGLSTYVAQQPCWPYASDEAVIASADSQAWLADLAVRNRGALEAAKGEATERLQHRMAQAEEEAEAKRQLAAMQEASIAAWVQASGTPNQQARYSEGLLPRKEVVEALRNEAFQVLDGLPRSDHLTASEVCTCEPAWTDAPCKVAFGSGTLEALTAGQYDALQALRVLVPDAAITPRWHEGTGQECDNEVRRYSLRVERHVGGFRFTREYALLA